MLLKDNQSKNSNIILINTYFLYLNSFLILTLSLSH